MDRENQQSALREGMDIIGSDGNKIGEIVAVQNNYIVVEKGFFFPTDYYIPTSAIANSDGEKVYLNVTKDAALDQGWDTVPGDVDYASTGVGTMDAMSTGTDHNTHGKVEHETEGDRLLIPVHEEELTATKRDREIGQVSIDKTVIEEERTLDVPLTEERVTVQRRTVDRDSVVGDDATAFQGGTIDVPIRGEEVQLEKRTRVSEEVEINKEAVQRTEQVGGTVRREELNIDETNVDQRDDSRRS